MDTLQIIITVMQSLVTLFTLCGMIYTFKQFIREPHDTLEERVAILEARQKEVEDRLHKGNKRFDEQDETNAILIHSTLALIEFEMQYCISKDEQISDGLRVAKEDLNKFLSRR